LPSVAEVEISKDADRGAEVPPQAKPAVTVRLVQPRQVKRAAAEKPSVSGPKPENSAVGSRPIQRGKATEISFVAPSAADRPKAAEAAPASWVTIED
jgi:hypothetical protein